MEYNEAHGIKPETIKKAVGELISISKEVDSKISTLEKDPESMSNKELEDIIAKTKKRMEKAAMDLDFETAAELRDKIFELKEYMK